jgi:stage II sporulation protein D
MGVAVLLAVSAGGCGYAWHGRGAHDTAPQARESSPGAGLALSGTQMIRVGLAQGVPEVSVSGRGPYVIKVYADTVSFRAMRGGETSRFSSSDTEGGTIRLAPAGTQPLVFDGTAYRGEIEIFASGPGSLSAVNVVDLESYLRGVLPGEIGSRPEEEIEAVKAQAVAARTYAVSSSGGRGEGGFDVFATVEDQVYRGADSDDPVCDRAVMETEGECLTYGGEPIHAYFHSTCGGRTEAREEVWELPGVPYLNEVWDTPHEDRFVDPFCADAPNFTWTERWSGDEIERLIAEQLPNTASTPVRGPIREVRDIDVTVRAPSGRVRWLQIETDAGTYRVFGDRVRWLLRRPDSGRILRSAWFDLEVGRRGGKVSEVVARGRGYGHGVGMCQHGAMEMARRGYSYAEILMHYYPGAALVRIPAAEGEPGGVSHSR